MAGERIPFDKTHFKDAYAVDIASAMTALKKEQPAIHAFIVRRTSLNALPSRYKPITSMEAKRHQLAMVLFIQAYPSRNPITQSQDQQPLSTEQVDKLEQSSEAVLGNHEINEFLINSPEIPEIAGILQIMKSAENSSSPKEAARIGESLWVLSQILNDIKTPDLRS